MRIEIEIPKEFEADYIKDRFADFFGRVMADMDYNGMCGNYECETAEMLEKAFKNGVVLHNSKRERGRLVDTNELIDIIEGNENLIDWQKDEFIKCVDACDTAYDVSNVLKGLRGATLPPKTLENIKWNLALVEAMNIVNEGRKKDGN